MFFPHRLPPLRARRVPRRELDRWREGGCRGSAWLRAGCAGPLELGSSCSARGPPGAHGDEDGGGALPRCSDAFRQDRSKEERAKLLSRGAEGAQLRSPLPTATHGCARPFLQHPVLMSHGATWVLVARWSRKQIAERILQPGGCPGSEKGSWVCAGGGDPGAWSCSVPAPLEAFQLLCHAQMLSGGAAPEVVPHVGPLWVQGLCSGAAPPLPSHASPQNLRLCLQKPSPLCAGRKWRLSLKGALRCDTNLFSTFPRLSFGTSLFWHRVLLPRWLCCGSEGKC